MKTLTKKAYAKVNLALDVLRRREDGYHDVKMIMHNINIYDKLIFELTGDSGEITISTNLPGIPTDDRNLIYKAIKLISDTYDISPSVHVNLTKNIPIEAGMAGGSTDCAATLHAMNELLSLKLDEQSLMNLGVKLGADVPYCIMARPALSEGIGEILTKVTPLPDCHVVVAKPAVSVSTGTIYKNLKLDTLKSHPDIDGMILALQNGDIKSVANRMENVMESVTATLHPEIEDIKAAMKTHGALNAIMSGSGPTVFGIFNDFDKANIAADFIRDKELAKQIFVTKPI